jgi:Zn-finger nucleic acid-binding protein
VFGALETDPVSMKCLNCGEPMRTVVAGIDFEECPRCDAHFFDRGALSIFLAEGGIRFAEITLREALEPPSRCRWCETRNLPDAERCSACDEPLAVRCGRDGQRMMSAAAGRVDVDVCPTCTALWLDGDDLRRLVDDLRAAPTTPVAELELIPMTHAHNRRCEVCDLDKPAFEVAMHLGKWQCEACDREEKVGRIRRMATLAATNQQSWVVDEREARLPAVLGTTVSPWAPGKGKK